MSTPSNTLLTDAELLLAQEGQPLNSSTLDDVSAQPGVDKDERHSQTKTTLLAALPSPELDLMLAADGTELSESQLDAVSAQPGVDKDALMETTRTKALAALKKIA